MYITKHASLVKRKVIHICRNSLQFTDSFHCKLLKKMIFDILTIYCKSMYNYKNSKQATFAKFMFHIFIHF